MDRNDMCNALDALICSLDVAAKNIGSLIDNLEHDGKIEEALLYGYSTVDELREKLKIARDCVNEIDPYPSAGGTS